MTFVVTENCIKCKYTDCVEVCIDCGVCVPECPAEAIVADNDPAAIDLWLGINREYAELWPNIVSRKEPLPDAYAMNGRADKIAEFLPEPGSAEEQAA